MTDYIITEEQLRNYRRGTITFEDIESICRHRLLSEALKVERERVVDSLITTFSKRMVKGEFDEGYLSGIKEAIALIRGDGE